MTAQAPSDTLMEDIVGLCKRRGFIFQSSEIYGGYNGFYDYGPLGIELRNNIKQAWWRDFVQCRDDIEGLDSSIIMHPKIWKASGHVDGFSDPMVDCKESKLRYRADQLFFAPVSVDGENIGYVSVVECIDQQEVAEKAAAEMKRKMAKQGELDIIELKEYTEAKPEQYELIPSPATGKPGSLTEPREFKLMFETKVGPLADDSAAAYLRPETAQGIFANYKNIVDTGRVKIPFGIAKQNGWAGNRFNLYCGGSTNTKNGFGPLILILTLLRQFFNLFVVSERIDPPPFLTEIINIFTFF